jgi:hypothetical protein
MGGTLAAVGPSIETSARALQMRRVDQGGEEVYAYIKFDASKAKRTVKPYQLTGAS